MFMEDIFQPQDLLPELIRYLDKREKQDSIVKVIAGSLILANVGVLSTPRYSILRSTLPLIKIKSHANLLYPCLLWTEWESNPQQVYCK